MEGYFEILSDKFIAVWI